MKIAVVAGGWHWPMTFYRQLAEQIPDDMFVVSHRHPELDIVVEEKREALRPAGPLTRGANPKLLQLDKVMYQDPPTVAEIQRLGWTILEAPNVAGDQIFLNQWLDVYDYRDYDVILNCHDDTWIRRTDLFASMAFTADWDILSNGSSNGDGVYPGYFRGSFEFWTKHTIEAMGGTIPVEPLALTRENRVDSPIDRQELDSWNRIGVLASQVIEDKELKLRSLSPFYRVSPWAIEGERGFLHRHSNDPQWSLNPGLEAYPL